MHRLIQGYSKSTSQTLLILGGYGLCSQTHECGHLGIYDWNARLASELPDWPAYDHRNKRVSNRVSETTFTFMCLVLTWHYCTQKRYSRNPDSCRFHLLLKTHPYTSQFRSDELVIRFPLLRFEPLALLYYTRPSHTVHHKPSVCTGRHLENLVGS